jgi:GH25 family lysozyme M1 (1,4-beta-N-acetylmuramidase)
MLAQGGISMKKYFFSSIFVVLTAFTSFTYISAENNENLSAAIYPIETFEELETVLKPEDIEKFKRISNVNPVENSSYSNTESEFDEIIYGYRDYRFDTVLPHSSYEVRWAKKYLQFIYDGQLTKVGVDRDESGYVSARDITLLKSAAMPRLPFFGIDVSKYQGEIDWLEVSKYVDFAIIRAGFGKDRHDNNTNNEAERYNGIPDGIPDQVDFMWEENISGTESYGVPKGIYWYSYATTPEEAEEEAYFCLDVIKGHKLEYPVFFDMEEINSSKWLQKNPLMASWKCTAIADAFVKVIEDNGYACGIYMSKSYIYNNIDGPDYYDYTWVAHWTGSAADVTDYQYDWQLWQFSGGETLKTTVPGIVGYIDWDICVEDIPTQIRKKHLNGY